MELTLSINPENTNAMAFLEFIKNLDFSNTGTIVIKYKNSDISYVSRRMIKEFKLKLGI